jgi:hypothetical protein
MSNHPAQHPYDPNRFPHFESPYMSPRLYDVMYDASGKTRAKNHLIMIARDEFLLCWLSNERMAVRLEGWRASVGLPEIVNDIADFLDRVAGRLGVPRRADLGRIPCTPQALFEDFIPEWCRLQDRLYTAYQRGREVMDATAVYVWNELRQPWPWLAGRLAYHVFQQAWERAMGITLVHQMVSHLDDHIWGPWVQPFRFVFETMPGELLTKARQRLMSEAHKAARNLQPDDATKSLSLPKGSPQKKQEDNARRGAGWLYSELIH